MCVIHLFKYLLIYFFCPFLDVMYNIFFQIQVLLVGCLFFFFKASQVVQMNFCANISLCWLYTTWDGVGCVGVQQKYPFWVVCWPIYVLIYRTNCVYVWHLYTYNHTPSICMDYTSWWTYFQHTDDCQPDEQHLICK